MRKIFNIILYLLFIIICLLLINTRCSAEIYPTAFTQNEINLLESCFNDNSYRFDTYSCFKDNNNYIICNLYNKPSANFKVSREPGNNFFTGNESVSGYWVQIYLNDGHRVYNSFTGIPRNQSSSRDIGNGNYYYYLYGNIPIYDSDSTTIMWAPEVNTPPSIINFSTQTYINNLIDGSFEYILVSSGSYAQYPLRLNINNGSSSDDTIRQKYITLEHDGPYADISIEPNQYQSYTIPKSDLIPIYNDTIYNMWLEYGEDFSIRTPIQTFTTDFSQSTIDNAVVDEQDATQQTAQNTEKIANELEQTNQFLTNDTINDADIDLPEISANDFTLSFFSTLVGSITDAFLDTTYDEVIEFDVRGEHYEIHSQQFNILGNVGLGYVKNFIALYWVFSIGYWIFCDARRRIYLMKEFKWTAMFADDISVKML